MVIGYLGSANLTAMRAHFVVICIFLGALGLAQDHMTFPNVDATFRVTSLCADPLNIPEVYEQVVEYTYAFEPVVQVDSLSWSAFGPDMGLLAMNGDRIYLRGGPMLGGDSTIVLYDFSLEVGDTAYFDQYLTFDHAVVTMIDQVLVSGHECRRLTLSNGDQWIQGIGSVQDPLRPIQPTPLGCGYDHLEFCGNYLPEGGMPYTLCLDVHVGIAPTLEPSPAEVTRTGSRSFILNGTKAGGEYHVVDTTGRLVVAGTFTNGSTSIHLHNAAAGVHLLHCGSGIVKLVLE